MKSLIALALGLLIGHTFADDVFNAKVRESNNRIVARYPEAAIKGTALYHEIEMLMERTKDNAEVQRGLASDSNWPQQAVEACVQHLAGTGLRMDSKQVERQEELLDPTQTEEVLREKIANGYSGACLKVYQRALVDREVLACVTLWANARLLARGPDAEAAKVVEAKYQTLLASILTNDARLRTQRATEEQQRRNDAQREKEQAVEQATRREEAERAAETRLLLQQLQADRDAEISAARNKWQIQRQLDDVEAKQRDLDIRLRREEADRRNP